MDSITIKRSKLNVSTIKSPLSGGGSILDAVGQRKTSKIENLAKIVRKNRISINSLVKSQETQNRNLTILKNIVQNTQKNIVKNIKNTQKNIVKNIKNTQKNVVENNQKDVVQNTQKNIVKNIKNIQKNIVKNIKNIQKNVVENNQKDVVQSAQNIQKNIVKNNQKDVVQNTQKNIVENNQKNKVGTVAKIVRKNRILINSLAKSQEVQDEKITRLKNIAKIKQQNIGKKLPGGTQDNLEKSLAETNKILVQIQEELMRSSALRSKEEKVKSDRAKRGASKAKLGAEESQLEKSSSSIRKSVGEKAEQTMKPVKGIFGRIMDFIGTLALGIAGNAIFGWLKDPENMEKVKGWFSWIKENWGWAAAAIGAIALMPLIGVIGGLIGSLGVMMPLFVAAVPFLAKALLIAGAAVLAWKGLEAGFNAIRNQVTGGSEFSAAQDILDKKLEDAGLDKDGKKRGKGAAWDFLGWAGTRKEEEMTDEQKKISAEVLAKRKELNALRDNMRTDIREKHSKMDRESGLGGMSTQQDVSKHNKSKSEAEKEIRAQYSEKISQLVPLEINEVEARKMGGHVKAGRPYLVGESGPELFSPNIDGSIVNNMRTEKIYQMISSRRKDSGGANIVNLPPITNKMPPPELPSIGDQATEVPNISSTNMADPYRQLSPMLYGITV